MPKPLPPNIDVYVEQKCLPGSYAMPAMEVALDHYSICYHVSGDRKWFSYEKVEIMHPGDIGLGMTHVYHRNLPMSDAPYNRYLIKFRKEALQPTIDLIGEQVFERMYFNHICRFTKESQAKIHSLFQEMLEEYERNSPFSQFILKGMLARLFLTIYEEKLPDSNEDAILPTFYDERIHNAIMYIEEHLSEELSLAELADHVSLSAPYFSKLFKDVLGTSLSEYITNARLQQAQILLGQTDLSIEKIAEKVGFANGNYFCNVFKKRYGVAPSEFRRSARG